MARWSCTWLAEHVIFACVSTAGSDVADLFAEEFGFEGVVNGYAETETDIPFGQLGCSGLIAFDGTGQLIMRAFTPTYLEARHKSFRLFEQWLKQTFGLNVPGPKEPRASLVKEPASSQVQTQQQVEGKLCRLGIEDLDREHEECDVALQQLLSDPNLESLRTLRAVLQRHFAHEEEMLAAHPAMPERALASHKEDHRQMLKIVQNALENGMTVEFLDEVKERFFSHIHLFDVEYANMVA